MSHPIRISASRLKQLKDCTVAFWYKEVHRLPDEAHWKTRVGTITHLLFECLLNPRRAALFQLLLLSEATTFEGVLDLRAHPALARFVEWQLRRFEVTRSSVEEVGELLRVALMGVKPYFTDAEGRYSLPPRVLREHRFKIQVGSATISGFIDLLLLWPDHAVVIDLKTQAKKWTRAEVPSNVQAIIYQLATYREVGLIPPVEFVMLRHAPAKRTPANHIQRVEAPSIAHLAGLEAYIQSMFVMVNQFGMEEAMSHPNPDFGFCERVCQFYRPFTYWARVKRADPNVTLEAYVEGKQPAAVGDDEELVKREHWGCVARWRGDGRVPLEEAVRWAPGANKT